MSASSDEEPLKNEAVDVTLTRERDRCRITFRQFCLHINVIIKIASNNFPFSVVLVQTMLPYRYFIVKLYDTTKDDRCKVLQLRSLE